MNDKKLTGMENIIDYVELIKTPWGRMFYDLLYIQLDVPQAPKMKILDFGSGLGVSSNYYAKWHDVTAVELNDDMINNRIKDNSYTQIHGGIDIISTLDNKTFDIILCHNVLEYIEDKEPILCELLRVLIPGGVLSLIKHNHAGKVFGYAVFDNAPEKALSALKDKTTDKINFIGKQYLYNNEDVLSWVCKYDSKIKEILGLRTFFGLGQDNDVKYSDKWYRNMLELECSVSRISEYANVAYYYHIMIEKG